MSTDLKITPYRRLRIRLPAAIILSLLMQAAAILVWATQLDARVNGIERQSVNNSQLNEKFARLEERLDSLKQSMGDLKRQLDRLTDKLLKP